MEKAGMEVTEWETGRNDEGTMSAKTLNTHNSTMYEGTLEGEHQFTKIKGMRSTTTWRRGQYVEAGLVVGTFFPNAWTRYTRG